MTHRSTPTPRRQQGPTAALVERVKQAIGQLPRSRRVSAYDVERAARVDHPLFGFYAREFAGISDEELAAEGLLASGEKPAGATAIDFEALDRIEAELLEFKRGLRDLIERHGGISEVARRSGIAQPALSRLLSSTMMPRRATLQRIERALKED